MPSRRLSPVLAALALTGSVGLLPGCAPDRDTALAITHARRRSPTVVQLRTECADRLRTDVGRSSDGKPEITIWGHPRLGRCRPTVTVHVSSDHLVDGATSMAVEVPPTP